MGSNVFFFDMGFINFEVFFRKVILVLVFVCMWFKKEF